MNRWNRRNQLNNFKLAYKRLYFYCGQQQPRDSRFDFIYKFFIVFQILNAILYAESVFIALLYFKRRMKRYEKIKIANNKTI